MNQNNKAIIDLEDSAFIESPSGILEKEELGKVLERSVEDQVFSNPLVSRMCNYLNSYHVAVLDSYMQQITIN